MFVRFVTDEIHLDSNQRLGIFHAIRYLRDDNELTEGEFKLADSLMTWFADNMESPIEFLNKQKSKKSETYISWFKDTASEHIRNARELSKIIEGKNVRVEFLRTKKPGKIVYEDEFQIFSRPFNRF